MACRADPRLTLDGKQSFKVRMGFGLHAGWAIEGAVGSLQKVDATYLSPHVNMAARLESASKQYLVPVLMSQNFYELMSDEGKEHCRRIDKVTVKGSLIPIDIYTYDCYQDQVFRELELKAKAAIKPSVATLMNGMIPRRKSLSTMRRISAQISPHLEELNTNSMNGSFRGSIRHTTRGVQPSLQSMKDSGSDTSIPGYIAKSDREIPQHTQRGRRESNKKETRRGAQQEFTSESETADVFERDVDIRMLRAHISREFRDQFDSGLIQYLTGDWELAKDELEQANDIMLEKFPATGGDGPSLAILNYMGEHDFISPNSWKNYRPLTSK
eukprot:CAMPEP_0119035430 /NCGR_PEP_ID=MMETSP1177-20130426/2426_1 /TAXON_ID=2985 /ORGANISM="Ochromonas sp, Strain CCMP1899" /LENGTH=327 /DNA_ID=CAMNT_0006993655 /DNA_START=1567 /DNA_END=2550 /DNA_ORIENTATION=-